MRRIFIIAAFVFAWVFSGTIALAGNPSNDARLGADQRIPCQGLYTAGVGNPPGTGGATVGTPGFAHVTENDIEMCHGGADPVGE